MEQRIVWTDPMEVEEPSPRPRQVSKATLAARAAREKALCGACDALWAGILEHADDWLYGQFTGGLAMRRLVASNDVLAEGRQLAAAAAARVRSEHAGAAKGASWMQAATFFYPLVPGASLPALLDRLGDLVATELPAVMACAQLPTSGGSPFRNESWPGGAVEPVVVTHYGLGEGGVTPAIKVTHTEQRFVRHPIHALFDACMSAASQFTSFDIAAAMQQP